jgi:hypothetical protein
MESRECSNHTPPPSSFSAKRPWTAERRAWPGVRALLAVVSSPTLRPDGTILQTPGYDPATGLLYRPNAEYPHIPEHPTRDDARAAVQALAEVVADVPFASAGHRAAWVAGILTLVGRFGFAGPAPAFVVDAPAPGSGKSLIADCAAIIATGKPAPRTAYDPDDAETRRLITSLAVCGAPLVLLDNIDVPFGNAALANALTGTEWRDRPFGQTAVTTIPLWAVWFATGNNVTYARDLGRRVCHIRIEAATAHPEERSGFRHRDLLAWVMSERPRLHAAALTILRAYAAAGRPPQRLTPWGSFEGWSNLIRSALVWAGEADSGQTRKEIRQSADSDVGLLSSLLSALNKVYGLKVRFTAADVVRRLTITPRGTDAAVDRLASALAEFCRLKDATPPGTHQFGMRLQKVRRRIVRIGDADYRLNSDERGNEGVPWFIERLSPPDATDACGRPRTRDQKIPPPEKEVIFEFATGGGEKASVASVASADRPRPTPDDPLPPCPSCLDASAVRPSGVGSTMVCDACNRPFNADADDPPADDPLADDPPADDPPAIQDGA